MLSLVYMRCPSARMDGTKIAGWILKLLVLLRAAVQKGEDCPCKEAGRWPLAAPSACRKPCEEGEGAYREAKDGLWLFPALAGMLQSCWCGSWWLPGVCRSFHLLPAQNWRSSNTENHLVFLTPLVWTGKNWWMCGSVLPSEMALVQLLHSGEISIWLHSVSTRGLNTGR